MGLKTTTQCLGYQRISGLSASTALTVPAGATLALIVAESQNVRWRDDGTAPTASTGMPLAIGVSLSYDGDLKAICFIEVLASANLNVSYYA
jgi:hypothetical protein